VTIEPEGNPAPQVINIMDALKKSVQKQSTTKVSDAVRKRMGKTAPKSGRPSSRERPTARARRTVN
jgi:non-homologous end joining protein Ku